LEKLRYKKITPFENLLFHLLFFPFIIEIKRKMVIFVDTKPL